jgi:hypothetical protein
MRSSTFVSARSRPGRGPGSSRTPPTDTMNATAATRQAVGLALGELSDAGLPVGEVLRALPLTMGPRFIHHFRSLLLEEFRNNCFSSRFCNKRQDRIVTTSIHKRMSLLTFRHFI